MANGAMGILVIFHELRILAGNLQWQMMSGSASNRYGGRVSSCVAPGVTAGSTGGIS